MAALLCVIAANAGPGVKKTSLLNPTTAELQLTDGSRMTVDFYEIPRPIPLPKS